MKGEGQIPGRFDKQAAWVKTYRIVHPGQQSYSLEKNITVIGLNSIPDTPDLERIFR